MALSRLGYGGREASELCGGVGFATTTILSGAAGWPAGATAAGQSRAAAASELLLLLLLLPLLLLPPQPLYTALLVLAVHDVFDDLADSSQFEGRTRV